MPRNKRVIKVGVVYLGQTGLEALLLSQGRWGQPCVLGAEQMTRVHVESRDLSYTDHQEKTSSFRWLSFRNFPKSH